MIAALTIVAVCALALNAYLIFLLERAPKQMAAERQQLITRITHPDFIPIPDAELPPDAEMLTADTDDEYATVGTIEGGPHLDLVEGDNYGLGDAS